MPMHCPKSDKGANGGTSLCNTLGVFEYQPPAFVGTKEKPNLYADASKALPGRWRGKQPLGSVPKRGAFSRLSTIGGTVTTDALFEPAYQRMYEGDGYSGDTKTPGLMNGRAAYTNTINTERYRETLRKEDRVTGGNIDKMASINMSNLRARRAEDADQEKAAMLDAMVRDRRYKPTSQALSIGTKLHMTASCNPQNYLPSIVDTDGKQLMPAAYRNPHAHRRSALTEKCWFKMGSKAGPPA